MDFDLGRYQDIDYTLKKHQVGKDGAMYWFVVEGHLSEKFYYPKEIKKMEIIRELKIKCEAYMNKELLKKLVGN
ncbi:chaperone protein DnaK [Leptospira ryugenii]|uniref:Chaperone protein DnaK n=1 Tax=Leptospira ryugenii TaxID=1917863 RepID=A0A2P2DXT7_9LEPT|nr:hypothetical protein [Leptospira ryugenii]GBF49442.1 chaperone protein DnaK [Leptospira ryugenii]